MKYIRNTLYLDEYIISDINKCFLNNKGDLILGSINHKDGLKSVLKLSVNVSNKKVNRVVSHTLYNKDEFCHDIVEEYLRIDCIELNEVFNIFSVNVLDTQYLVKIAIKDDVLKSSQNSLSMIKSHAKRLEMYSQEGFITYLKNVVIHSNFNNYKEFLEACCNIVFNIEILDTCFKSTKDEFYTLVYDKLNYYGYIVTDKNISIILNPITTDEVIKNISIIFSKKLDSYISDETLITEIEKNYNLYYKLLQ